MSETAETLNTKPELFPDIDSSFQMKGPQLYVRFHKRETEEKYRLPLLPSVSHGLSHTQVTLDMNNVHAILPYFLGYDTSMTTIQFLNMDSIASIGSHFLWRNSSVENVGWAFADELKIINPFFMCHMQKLKTVSFAHFPSVEHIGEYFMNHCHTLREVDLSGLRCLKGLGKDPFGQCPSLGSIWVNKENAELVKNRVPPHLVRAVRIRDVVDELSLS